MIYLYINMIIKEIIKGRGGIYKITNLLNKKFYIGSSKSLYQRAYSYKTLSKQGKVHNQHLQNSLTKYGRENFTFEVIEYIEDINTLWEREQYYIDTLKPEYNKKLIVESNYGVILSLESRKKISEKLKDSYRKGIKKVNRLQIHNIQISLYKENGDFVSNFSSLRDTANYLEVSYPSVSYALKSPRRVIRNHIVLLPNEEVSNFIGIPINKTPYKRKVSILDTFSGKNLSFDTCLQCAITLKCKQETIKKHFINKTLLKKQYKVISYE